MGPGPSLIRLQGGGRIEFGLRSEGSQLRVGPLPLLCNLQLPFLVYCQTRAGPLLTILIETMSFPRTRLQLPKKNQNFEFLIAILYSIKTQHPIFIS